jgi:hypothetical protein
MEKFYIYLHIRKSDNVIFYVGKGHGKRAWSKDNRNEHWCNTVKLHGYDITILAKNLSEKEAFELEKKFILFYGRQDKGLGTLVNWSDGGEGNSGLVHSQDSIEANRLNQPSRRAVSIDGITFNSLSHAAKVLEVDFNSVKYKVTKKHFPTCFYLGEEKEYIPKEETHSKISIDGIIYESMSSAEKILLIPRKTIKYRLEKNTFPNYFYVGNPNTYIKGSSKSKKVSVNGVVYKSINEASKVTGVSRVHIRRLFDNPNNDNYQYVL